MIAEQIEFQISQYADGTLPAAEMKYVDDLLQSDAEAQKMLAEYRRLNNQLSQLRTGPAIQWDRLADHISNRIDQVERPVVAGRIGFFSSRWRVAAAVLIVGSAAIITHHAMRRSQIAPAPVPSSLSDVTGPQAEVARGSPVQDISVGPSPALARSDPRYGEGVISQGPAKIVIGQVPSKPAADSHLH